MVNPMVHAFLSHTSVVKLFILLFIFLRSSRGRSLALGIHVYLYTRYFVLVQESVIMSRLCLPSSER